MSADLYFSEKLVGKEKKRKKEEPSSVFQRQRVDMLLEELSKKFPPKIPCLPHPEKAGQYRLLSNLTDCD